MQQLAGFRKGKWTEEEDKLLRSCVQKLGEGKWHLVPERAGLNRCRKSCRIRWLNYLKPDIKRGHFTEDEVDMIIRLRRLLGNRWSMIAGRLPGRTGNDVKNFWNTNLRKFTSNNEDKKEQPEETAKTHSVIKPKSRSLSTAWMRKKPLFEWKCTSQPYQSVNNNGAGKCTALQPAFVSTDNDVREISTQANMDGVLESEMWDMLDDKNQGVWPLCGQQGKIKIKPWDAELVTMTANVGETSMDDHSLLNVYPLGDNGNNSSS